MRIVLLLLIFCLPAYGQVQMADNYAALKALNPGSRHSRVAVAGHTIPGDGGGGVFYWSPGSVAADDGGMILQATGVATGRWMRVPDGSVSVRYFGATDNDLTDDDAVAFQRTIAYAQTTKRAVHVPAGTYQLMSRLEITAAIKIYGDGVRGHSTLKLTGDIDGILLSWSDVSLEGLTIDGQGTTGTGIIVHGSSTKIRDCTIINCGDGLRVGNPDPVGQANDCFFEGLRITNNSRDGVHISSAENDVQLPDANANTFIRINVQNNGRDGIHINKSMDNHFLGIQSEVNGRYGVLVSTNANGHVFLAPYCEANASDEMRLEGPRNRVEGWRGGIGNDEVVTIGEGNHVLGRMGAHGHESVFKTPTPFLDLRIFSTNSIDGQWQMTKNNVDRGLDVAFIRSGGNPAWIRFTNALSGSPGGRAYVQSHTMFADRGRFETLVNPSESQLRTSMNNEGPFSVLSFNPDNIQVLFDYDYTNGHIARATSIAAIKKISGGLLFYGSDGNVPGTPPNELLRLKLNLNTGNFGVGTGIDPLYKLDVDGHTRIRFGTNAGRLWLGGDGQTAATISLRPGTNSPVGVATAFPGSIYLDSTGKAWFKESGVDDTTGWAQMVTSTMLSTNTNTFAINETDTFIPYRTNATTLADSPLWVIGGGVATDGTYSAQGYGDLGTLNYSALTMGHTGTNGAVVIHSVSAGDAGSPRDFLFQANGATQAKISASSGYADGGTKFLSDDGTYKVVVGEGGALINPTDNYLPFRTNATEFADSPLRASTNNVVTSGNYIAEGAGTVEGTDFLALSIGHTGTDGSAIFRSLSAGTNGPAKGFLFEFDGSTGARIASPSGYTGMGTKFLSDDGTYKTVEGGVGGGSFEGDFREFTTAGGTYELMNDYAQVVFDATPMETDALSPGTYIVTAIIDYNQYRTNGNQVLVKLVNSESTFDLVGTEKLVGPTIVSGEFYGNWNVTVQGKTTITSSGQVEVWAKNSVAEDEEASPRSAITDVRSSISWIKLGTGGGSPEGAVLLEAPEQTITGNLIVDGVLSPNLLEIDNMEIEAIYVNSTNQVLVAGSDGELTNSVATAAELLNIVGGTSPFQAQIDDKLPLAGGTITGNLGASLSVGNTTFADLNFASQTNVVSSTFTIAHATNGVHGVDRTHVRWLFVPSGGPHTFNIPSGWRTNVFSPKPPALTNGTITKMILNCGGPTSSPSFQTNVYVSFEYFR